MEDESTDRTARPPTADSPAQTLWAGRYSLVEKLGHGSFGEVWKAIDTTLSVKVALKMLKPPPKKGDEDPTIRDEVLKRLRREAQALCMIVSENVVQYREFKEEPTPFLVMELLSGETLLDRLNREGKMSISQVKDICQQLCNGLQAAHEKGVIHRDLKPGNIFCVQNSIKIIDFGLMKHIGPPKELLTEILVERHAELTLAGTLMGTLHYIAPEQLNGKADFRSDLWSLAVILYRLLTAKLPFVGRGDRETMIQIQFQEPPPPSTVVPDLSAQVDTFFSKALQKDPDLRFASATEFGAAFDKLDGPVTTCDSSPVSKPVDQKRNEDPPIKASVPPQEPNARHSALTDPWAVATIAVTVVLIGFLALEQTPFAFMAIIAILAIVSAFALRDVSRLVRLLLTLAILVIAMILVAVIAVKLP